MPNRVTVELRGNPTDLMLRGGTYTDSPAVKTAGAVLGALLVAAAAVSIGRAVLDEHTSMTDSIGFVVAACVAGYLANRLVRVVIRGLLYPGLHTRHAALNAQFVSKPPTVSPEHVMMVRRAAALHPDDLRTLLAAAADVSAARKAAERRAAIDDYEAHVSDPDWRKTPSVEWMRREAELRGKLPTDYPLPDGVAR